MAEFQEVCRQALRMAKTMNAETGYPMDYLGLYITTDGEVPAELGRVAVTPEKIERDIMEWAAAYPEPKYPSWNEAWEQLFPNAYHSAHACDVCSPCIKHFLPPERVKCSGVRCVDCLDEPIPADIAEKLGVKPLEV